MRTRCCRWSALLIERNRKISKSFLNKPKRDAREQRQERKDSQAELGVQLEMVEGDLIAWWRLVCVKHPIAILVYYRGDWCPFCRAWLRRWNRILPEIMLKGGVVRSELSCACVEARCLFYKASLSRASLFLASLSLSLASLKKRYRALFLGR